MSSNSTAAAVYHWCAAFARAWFWPTLFVLLVVSAIVFLQSARRTRRVPALGIVFLGILYALLLLLVAEGWARHAYPSAMEDLQPNILYNHASTANHTHQFYFGSFDGTSPPTPPIGWVTHFNAYGLNSPEIAMPKPKDVYRVLITGDSFIQGFGPNNAPAAVRSALAARRTVDGRRIEIINGGTSSYSALLHLVRLKHQLLALSLDAVLFLPDLTDVCDDKRYRDMATFDEAGNVTAVTNDPDRVFLWERMQSCAVPDTSTVRRLGVASRSCLVSCV